MTANELLTAIRDDLVAAGLVRKPGVIGTLPPMHVEPLDPPAPYDRADSSDPAATRETDSSLVLSLRVGSEIVGLPGAAYARTWVVDIIARTDGTAALKAARNLEAEILGRYVRASSYGGGVTLAEGLPSQVQPAQILQSAGLQPVGVVGGIRTDRMALAVSVVVA